MNKQIIQFYRVQKEYKLGKTTVHALNDISLSICEGEFTAFAGPSGSGKTTILNLIGCIDSPTRGTVTVSGKNHAEMNDKDASLFRNRTIGYIFQNFNLIPVLNVYENIEYPLRISKLKITEEKREKIHRLIRSVGLESYEKHIPDKLSGGQRQRVAVARALVMDPEIIIADEPTANLDHVTGEGIIEIMKNMNRQFGTTCIFSTHSDLIIDHADRVVRVLDGTIESDIKKEGVA